MLREEANISVAKHLMSLSEYEPELVDNRRIRVTLQLEKLDEFRIVMELILADKLS